MYTLFTHDPHRLRKIPSTGEHPFTRPKKLSLSQPAVYNHVIIGQLGHFLLLFRSSQHIIVIVLFCDRTLERASEIWDFGKEDETADRGCWDLRIMQRADQSRFLANFYWIFIHINILFIFSSHLEISPKTVLHYSICVELMATLQ